MAPFRAEEPYNTDEAPFNTSICSTFSMGMKPQTGLPASPRIRGISSTRIITRLPSPELNPLPPRIWGSLSTMATPGVCSMALSILVTFLFSTKVGLITSTEEVSSCCLVSYFDAETTIMSNCLDVCSMVILRLGVAPAFTSTTLVTFSYPMAEKMIVFSPGGTDNSNFPFKSDAVPPGISLTEMFTNGIG